MNPYDIVSINSAGWRIEENGVRSFLFLGRDKALLVDTGFGTGNLREAVESLTDLPVMLVNTHADRDHIGCNGLFNTAFLHPAEFDRLQYGKEQPLPASPLWEGDVIDLGTRRFQVILIPGHTPGSIALLDGESRILIAGDSVQTGNIFLFGPGRNIHAYMESLRKLIAMQDRFDTVYPSHGAFPVPADILPKLLRGAQDILAGSIHPAETEVHGSPMTVYDTGTAKFLYQS